MKKFTNRKEPAKNIRKGLSLLLAATLVVSSLVLGLGQLQTQAAQASDQLGTFRVSSRTNAQNCAGTGTDADFELLFTYDDGGNYFSGNFVPDGDMEESQTNSWVVSNVPVRPITSIKFRMMNYANNDDWYWDWAKIEYCYDGTNYVQVGYNDGDGQANGAGYTIDFNYNGAIDTTYMRTLTWSGNGGTVNGGSTYVVYAVQGATYPNNANNVPTTLTRTGHTFNGWSPAIPSVCPQADTTYYAQWGINQYNIYFNGNGGSTPATITQNYGTTVTVPSSSRTGYTFTGWSPTCPATMPAYNTTCVAQWSINKYHVYFDEAGGSAVLDIYQDYGSTVTPPADPTKTGYTFAGWSPAVPATIPAGDTTCVAQWTLNSYNLTFDANGGTGGTGPTLTPYGSPISAPAVSRTGYTFNAWSPTVPATMPAANSTYTASWNINTYYINFNANTGSGTMANQGIVYGGSANLTGNAFTKSGYSFNGWNTAANGSGTAYANGASFGPMGAGNVTLYAQWSVNSYYVYFDEQGGSEVGDIYQSYGSTITAPANPTKAGFNFTGWVPAVPATMPVGGTTCVAQWTPSIFTIFFDEQGGTTVADITQNYGTSVTPPAPPTKLGYTFNGWNPTVPATMPATNTTCVAQWTANNYQVLFNANGGSGTMINQSFVYDTAQNLTANGFSRVGYTWFGWNTAANGSGTSYTNGQNVNNLTTAPSGIVTFYAVWQVNQYTITYNINDATGTTPSPVTQNYGTTVVLPTQSGFTYTGRTFYGWNTTTGAITSIAPPYTMPAYSQTLYAVWGADYNAVITAADLADNTSLPANALHDPGFLAPDGEWYEAAAAILGYNGGYYTRDMFSTASITTLENAVNAVSYSKMKNDQETVDAYEDAITNAYANLELAIADYGPLQTKVNYAGTLISTKYTVSTWNAVVDAVAVANDYIAAQYKAPLQWYVNEIYGSLNDAINALEWIGADYTGVQAAWLAAQTEINKGLYTTESVAALNNFHNTIVPDLTLQYYDVAQNPNLPFSGDGQTIVNYYMAQIISLTNALQLRPANFSGVNNAIYDIPDNENTITVTVGSHDKNSSDISSIWLDSNGNTWALSSITNTTTLVFTKAIGTKYTMPYGAGKFTYSSGSATHTADIIHTEVIPNVDADYLRSIYTDGSVTNLIDQVTIANNPDNRAKMIDEQATVDGYANDPVIGIIKMTSELDPIDANYESLDQALDLEPAWPSSYYTDITYTAFNNAKIAGAAVPRDLDITEQQQINDATLLIDITFTALELKQVSYTVKYQDAGANDLLDPVNHENLTAGDWITENAAVITGYTPQAAQIQQRLTGTDSENIITFIYNIKQYTVSFEENGGSAVTDITQNYNTQVFQPAAPTKTGYTFANWYTDAGLTTLVTWPHTLVADVIFYAKWTPISYTIIYSANSGEGTTGNSSHSYDLASNLTANGFTKVGSTFLGWATTSGGVKAYNDEQSVTNLTTTPDDIITFYAVWQINNYDITFAANGGTGGTGPDSMPYGTTLTAPTVTRTGFTFNGWNPAVPATVPAANSTYTAQWTINNYDITFDANGGAGGTGPTSMQYGSPLSAPTVTRTGYTFDGWSPAVPANVPAANTTYTAQWTINQYTVSFDEQGGSTVADITQDYGSAITAPANPTKTGYTFNGWLPAVPLTMPAENTECVAQWTINNYDIIFDANGGTGGTGPVSMQYDSPLAAPTVTRTGYTFDGWSPAVPANVPAANTTYTAQWTINQYTISFDEQGGSTVADITQNYNSAITAPANPTKTGYTFAGWLPVVPSTMPAANTECVAQWTINQYTVSFDEQGGSTVADITQDYNTAITAPANPTKTGYTFAGWLPVVPSTMPAANTECVAQWTVNQYTVSFDEQGGSTVADITQDYGSVITAPANPTKTGYDFAGWLPVVPATMPAANTECVAQWTVKQYTVSFDEQGGSPVADITQDYNTAITAPANPTKTGYTFAGWLPVVPSMMPAANTECVAQWTINQYTISFDEQGGSTVADITQNYNTAITAPANPTKTGYTFAGWLPVVPSTMPAANTECVAQWTINQYTVSFDEQGGSTVADITQDYNTAITAPANPTKTGYTFNGWLPTVPSTMPAENTECVAQWTKNQSTITFELNGGTSPAIDPITLDEGADVTAPENPTRDGFTFAGWSPAVPAVMPVDDLTCVAQWTKNQSTITFNSAGGSAVAPITLDEGATVTAPADPTLAGYTFAGWLPVVPEIMPVDDVTCVAQWTKNQSTITFDLNGGTSAAIDPITLDEGADVTAPADPTLDGYTFAGWLPIVPETMPVEDLTCVAQWTKNQSTITFDLNGGTSAAIDPITQDEGTAVTAPADPAKTGYTFAGWLPVVPAIMPVDDVTCVAQWTKNQSTITFDLNGGTSAAIDPITQDEGTAVTPPADPARTGYTFAGWLPVVPVTMPVDDLTCVAQWTKNQSTITFDLNGGTSAAIDPITQDEGTAVTPPADPARTGYTFAGWLPIVPEIMPVDDVTCVAQWTKNQSTITFDLNGGTSAAIDPITQDEGTAVTAPADPARTGYTFAGWLPVVPVTMPVDDVTCVAQWTAIPTSTITFDSAGGSAVAPITQDEGTAVTAPDDPTRDGYIFAGWLPVVPAIMPVDDVACVAQWTPAVTTSTITFDLNGGTSAAIDPITQDEGTTVTAPADPTREGYTFAGWDPVVPSVMPADDVLCVAQWLMDPVLVPAEGSTTVINNTDNFIYGLAEGMFQADFESMFVEVLGNGRLEITPVFEGLIGTGTKVELINNSNEEVIATYYVVIFGDVTGDGLIDAVDADSITNYQNFALEWDFEASPYLFVASDLSGDTLVDAFDADIITNYQNFVIGINQATGEVTSL